MRKTAMNLILMNLALVMALACPGWAEEPLNGDSSALPYKDDPAIHKILEGLGEGESIFLPEMKTAGEGIDLCYGFAKRGPDVRDYGNKLSYAPDRETAMYCGANHGAPSRLNDASEYHLGSNTWHLVCPPAGGDQGKVLRARIAVKEGRNVEQNKAFLKEWYTENVELRDGYLQTAANGGPVEPWHTWDGVCYDEQARCMLWAVLDTDNQKKQHQALTRHYAEFTGQDPDKLLAQLKPSSAMYMYSPQSGRWKRQMGEGPFPYMRGMGGSLIYVPDLKKTIWYCSVDNVSPNDRAMWAYDAVTNAWVDLKPNGGKDIRTMTVKTKESPDGSAQMAYSSKHRKIVAVNGRYTWSYDIDKNEWSKLCEAEENRARDSSTVFAYDSNADVFLLLDAPDRYKPERILRAYHLVSNKWESITPKGTMISAKRNAGYYDPRHNVFVIYNAGPKVWIYRHKKSSAANTKEK